MRCRRDTILGGLLIDILYDLTLTKDGGITVAAANQEMQGRMLNAIGLLHLLQDERFNSMKKLVENLHIFRDLVARSAWSTPATSCSPAPRSRSALRQMFNP